MAILGWILSIALAGTYVLAGGLKLATPRAKLLQNPNMAWVNDFKDSQVKGIGTAEVLGAIGVILPWVTAIVRVLTPIAAIGLVVLQIGAMVTHGRRGERKAWPANASLLLLALAVAIIRFSQL